MKVEEVPFENLTIEELMELAQNGARAIVDGDKKVFRIMPRRSVDNLQAESEALNVFLAALK